MDLRHLTSVVLASSKDDWHHVAGAFQCIPEPRHETAAVYIPDIDIRMAWGLAWNESFEEPWVKKFANPRARGVYLDILYCNALVLRVPYVQVDEGRVSLPLPLYTKAGKLKTTKSEVALVSLIESIANMPRQGFHPYESDVEKAGIAIVDERWPHFPTKHIQSTM